MEKQENKRIYKQKWKWKNKKQKRYKQKAHTEIADQSPHINVNSLNTPIKRWSQQSGLKKTKQNTIIHMLYTRKLSKVEIYSQVESEWMENIP